MALKFTSELTEGMITEADALSANGMLIIPKDTVITKSIINKLLQNNIMSVNILDESLFKQNTSKDVIEQALIDDSDIKNTPIYKKFKRRYDKNVEDLKANMNDIIQKNAPIDSQAMIKNTLNIIEACDTTLGVMNLVATLKEYDDSTFNHCVNVSLICYLIGKWLGKTEEECKTLIVSGMFHDIGKLLIPDSIIKKPGPLTDKEYSIVKNHPKIGYELLKKQNVDIHIQYSALMHHEKRDGSGYPLKLIDDQIDEYAQIITIADIYEALTANRVYRSALDPFTVIGFFEESGLQKYNTKYLMTFLEHVVNSYMNCKVKLSNGEEGDVVYINRVSLSKPMIKTKTNDFIDLSKVSDIKIEKVID